MSKLRSDGSRQRKPGRNFVNEFCPLPSTRPSTPRLHGITNRVNRVRRFGARGRFIADLAACHTACPFWDRSNRPISWRALGWVSEAPLLPVYDLTPELISACSGRRWSAPTFFFGDDFATYLKQLCEDHG